MAEDVYNPDEEFGEEEAGVVPPPPQSIPAFYRYIKYILETEEAPPETRSFMWVAFTKDIKLGNLRPSDELYIRIGLDNFMLATVRALAQHGGMLTHDTLRELIGVRTVMPAILSRGRHGFERTLQNAQISATLTGGKEEVRETPFSRVTKWFKSAFGGHEE